MLNALQNAAEKSRGSVRFSVWAAHRFRAGLRFGLRPSEWRGARFMYLEDGELALEVPNGKHNSGVPAQCRDSSGRQLEIDVHGMVREQDAPLLGSVQNTRTEARMHVSVHALHIPA